MSEPALSGDADPAPQPGESASVLDALLSLAIAGDAGARAQLLTVLRPMVLQYCRTRLGRQETGLLSAEDVAQDVCLAVVNALATYQITGRSFRAFVYGIAAHKVADTFRAIGRNRVEPVAELPDSPVLRGGPEEQTLAVELTSVVNRLLHLLSQRQREVLLMRIVAGLSAEETAHALGSTPGAIRVAQHRALNFLRAQVSTS
jgi:RNA polymerase sigma-70 factor (ECF subfamily)